MRRTAALLPLLALAACESVDSEAIRTDAMYADITVETDGAGTATVGATLRVGGPTSNTFVELAGGDRLSVKAGEQAVDLTEQSFWELHSYSADLPIDAEDTEYVIAFERSIDTSAPASSVTMPAPFDVVAPEGPEGGDTFSREADAITITWDPAEGGDDMVIEVESDCTVHETFALQGDPGTVTLEPGDLMTWDSMADTTCAAELHVLRMRAGQLDTAYGEGGTIRAVQRRVVEVRLAP
jgi:hypothetical protein